MPDYAKMTKPQLLDELFLLRQQCEASCANQRALEEENERYQNFLNDPIMIGCYELDLRGNITYINEKAHGNLGYDRDEFMQRTGGPLHVSHEAFERVRDLYRKVYNTGNRELFTYQVRDKEGYIRTVEAEISLRRDKEGKPVGFRGVSRDITDRENMLQELGRYRDFFENVEDICFETDLKGNLTFVNDAASLKLGFVSKHPLIGMNYRQYSATPAEDRKIAQIFNEVYRTGKTNATEYDIVDAKGVTRHLHMSVALVRDEAGAPLGFRGISRDVSEQRKFELEQERYRNFLENIEDGCFETDLAGHFQFCNEAALRLLGFSWEELQTITYKNYLKPESAKEMRAIFGQIYVTGRPAMYTHEMVRKDGEARILIASASLIRDREDRPVGFRGIFQDITDRKRLEEQEAKLTKQLHQAQKMEAIGTLAGGIAHDFNNLLMGIQGYTSLMLLGAGAEPSNFEKLKAIEQIIQSGADLTKQLLGYARGGRYEVKPLNLNATIEKTASMFGRTKKELQIYLNLLPEVWTVEADEGQIEQVLLNLFVNAWQAMPGGGSLYLESKNVVLDEDYVRPYEVKPGPFVKVSVTDTGVGMDEKMKARIFEPFFTTKEMGRGTGIGLASVYGIVQGHKGIITVYSEKGQGATFNIYLPASEKAALQRGIEVSHENLKGHETILLADDEEMIVSVTSEMLRQLGYQVLIARNGEEAVHVYGDHPGKIDLVIMDMIMPGGGGGPAVDKISKINPDVKVILSSGYSLNGMIKEVLGKSANRTFIQKPFMLSELSQKIRAMLEQK